DGRQIRVEVGGAAPVAHRVVGVRRQVERRALADGAAAFRKDAEVDHRSGGRRQARDQVVARRSGQRELVVGGLQGVLGALDRIVDLLVGEGGAPEGQGAGG